MNENLIESDWRAVLKHEFEARENSFLIQLRCGPGWDREAHQRLFVAMRECCKAHEGQTHIERWIADGFWYMDFYPDLKLKEQERRISRMNITRIIMRTPS